ncbi:MAG TPA: radical SAM protein [Polyangiaceae bacterium]
MIAPRTASILTNLRCNQACLWCTRRAAKDEPRFVQGAAVRARLDEALAAGSREIVLTGGEPSMRGDLVDLVRHARAGGAERIVLETNGTLLDEARAKALRAAGLDVARVNVPGLDAACDSLTRDPGGFERAMEGARALASAGVAIEAAVTLVRSAVAQLTTIPARLRDLLGPALHAVVVGFPVDAADPSELLSLDEAAACVLALERVVRPLGITVRISTPDPLPPCAFDGPSRPRVTRFYAMTTGAPPREGYAHVAGCERCKMKDRCPGIADAYVARFGAPAVNPVEDDRTRRRLALVSTVEEQIERELASSHLFTDASGATQTEETIRVVFRCNQSCTFCFVSTHLPAPPADAVEAAIRAAGQRGARIVLSGGEPTLDPKLLDRVRLARSVTRGLVVVQTNAVRLDDASFVAKLEEAGLDEAFVSLHGATAEVSDAVTEAPGTFRRTVAGIDNLHASRIKVMLNFVVCGKNHHEMPDYVRMVAARWPRASLNVSFVGPSTDLVPRDRALVPRYTDALPSITSAVAEARRLGMTVGGFESMCGLPLCLVPGGAAALALPEIPEGFDKGEFLKTDECARCALAPRCYGLRRGYAEIHGTGELRAQQG